MAARTVRKPARIERAMGYKLPQLGFGDAAHHGRGDEAAWRKLLGVERLQRMDGYCLRKRAENGGSRHPERGSSGVRRYWRRPNAGVGWIRLRANHQFTERH